MGKFKTGAGVGTEKGGAGKGSPASDTLKLGNPLDGAKFVVCTMLGAQLYVQLISRWRHLNEILTMFNAYM